LKTAVVAAVLCAWCALAGAQTFPDRPLRLVVGQAAGTSPDLVARAVAAKWSEFLGQPVIVDNRPGAGESIAAETVAKASDGYTLLFGSIASHGIGPALSKALPYDPDRDFAPISMVATVPNVLVVNPAVPAQTLAQFLAYSKAHPGALNYASTVVGTSTHLGMELLKVRTSIDLVHVPYKSGSAAFADLMSGQFAVGLFNLPSQLPLIRGGKVRALAVSSRQRSEKLPGVPSIEESGVRGYEVVVWYAVFAPAAASAPARARLHADLVKAIESPELRERLAGQLGAEPTTSTPEALAAYSRAEIEKWRRVAREAGIKPE